MACATLKRSLDFDPVYHNVHPTKRPRCAPMVISPSSSPPSTSTRYSLSSPHSVFSSVCPRMSPETMTRNIHEEIRRFERRKLLRFHSKSAGSLSPPYTTSDSVGSTFSPDKPLFTFRQVGAICERLINERENQIREEYDRFLIMKLTEQYESFVNFSNDQVQKRFDGGAIPSYLS